MPWLIFLSLSNPFLGASTYIYEDSIHYSDDSNNREDQSCVQLSQCFCLCPLRTSSYRFRWAFCQLGKLRRCLSPRIRQALEELPDTLDETYERTLLDINEENWAYAHRLFQCIVVARRPLRVEELAEIFAFKSKPGGSLTFEGNWRPENPRDMVLSTCSSLIAVVNVDGWPMTQFSTRLSRNT